MRDRGKEGDRDSRGSDKNIFSYALDVADGINRRVDRATTRMNIPTMPFYDSNNFPDDAVYGQIAVDKDDPGTLWIYGRDDQWHQVSGGLKYGIASYNSWEEAPVASGTDVPYDTFVQTPGGPFTMTGGVLHVISPGFYIFRTTAVFRGITAPSDWTVGITQFVTAENPFGAFPAQLLTPEPYSDRLNTTGSNSITVNAESVRTYGPDTVFPTLYKVWANYSGFAPSRIEVSTSAMRIAPALAAL